MKIRLESLRVYFVRITLFVLCLAVLVRCTRVLPKSSDGAVSTPVCEESQTCHSGGTGTGNGEVFNGDPWKLSVLEGVRDKLVATLYQIRSFNHFTLACTNKRSVAGIDKDLKVLLDGMNVDRQEKCESFLKASIDEMIGLHTSQKVPFELLYSNAERLKSTPIALDAVAATTLGPPGSIFFLVDRLQGLDTSILFSVLVHETLHKLTQSLTDGASISHFRSGTHFADTLGALLSTYYTTLVFDGRPFEATRSVSDYPFNLFRGNMFFQNGALQGTYNSAVNLQDMEQEDIDIEAWMRGYSSLAVRVNHTGPSPGYTSGIWLNLYEPGGVSLWVWGGQNFSLAGTASTPSVSGTVRLLVVGDIAWVYFNGKLLFTADVSSNRGVGKVLLYAYQPPSKIQKLSIKPGVAPVGAP